MEYLDRVKEVLDYSMWGISLYQFILAFIIILITLIFRRLVIQVSIDWLKKRAAKSKVRFDEKALWVIEKPIRLMVFIIGMYLAVITLNPPVEPVNFRKFFDALLKTLISLSIAWVMIRLTEVVKEYFQERAQQRDDKLMFQLTAIVAKTTKIFIGIVFLILIIQNLGYSVSSLLAGLGIGGLAVALAAKDTLGNFFGTVTIFLDRPFIIGDWIITDGVEGNVESIGFRSTKIRTFARSLVTIPNNIMANLKVENMSKRPMQRVYMTIGVTYDTPPDKMEKGLAAIREIIGGHPHVHKDYYQIYFTGFGASSLDIMLYYFIELPTWAEFLKVREQINLSIMRALAELGIEFAFPTQTIYLKDMHKTGCNES